MHRDRILNYEVSELTLESKACTDLRPNNSSGLPSRYMLPYSFGRQMTATWLRSGYYMHCIHPSWSCSGLNTAGSALELLSYKMQCLRLPIIMH